MRNLGVILLALTLVFSFQAQAVYAAEVSTYDLELTNYLDEVSTIRGFEVTEEDIEESLATFGLAKEDFTTLDEMKAVLGDVIEADLSNLNTIYDDYDLNQSSLTELLAEYGEEIEDYIFINDLDMDLYFYTDSTEGDDTDLGQGAFPEIDQSMILEMIGEIGLSEDELTNIQEHYVENMEYLSSDEVAAQLEELNTRMTVLSEAINAKVIENPEYQPTEAEVSEIGAIYDEMLSIYKLKLDISVVKDGVVTTLTLAELMQLQDLQGADFSIQIYNLDNELLADAVIPSELIESELGGIIGDGDNDEQADPVDEEENVTVETEKGGQLPKTAANYVSNAILGMLIAMAGILVFRKVRADQSETLQK